MSADDILPSVSPGSHFPASPGNKAVMGWPQATVQVPPCPIVHRGHNDNAGGLVTGEQKALFKKLKGFF